jgi:ArsR family transcriptional regulator
MHEPASSQAASKADPATLLASVDAYLRFLEEHFAGVEIDFAMEAEAHALLNDPPRMQALVVSHLRSMWHEVLAPEWERVTPILQESAAAFQQIDFAGMPPVEAARIVLGQEIGGKWDNLFDKARQIIFVPSAHLGPYVGKFMNDQVLWLLFGARLPEGAPVRSSALNRSELLVRLSAITDDTRLRILALLSQHDELCAQELMTRLNLTQSATSRHLRQLSATGYVTEQWREGAKCYTLNRGRIDDTFRALARFLDGS